MPYLMRPSDWETIAPDTGDDRVRWALGKSLDVIRQWSAEAIVIRLDAARNLARLRSVGVRDDEPVDPGRVNTSICLAALALGLDDPMPRYRDLMVTSNRGSAPEGHAWYMWIVCPGVDENGTRDGVPGALPDLTRGGTHPIALPGGVWGSAAVALAHWLLGAVVPVETAARMTCREFLESSEVGRERLVEHLEKNAAWDAEAAINPGRFSERSNRVLQTYRTFWCDGSIGQDQWPNLAQVVHYRMVNGL